MITKERLEELIEQSATIYAIVKNPFIGGYSQILEVEEIDLKVPIVKEISEDGKQFLYYNYILDLQDIFETEEDARFALRFKRIPRTVYLDLPTWEEFTTKTYRCCFFGKSDKITTLDCFNGKTLEINENETTIFEKPLTKENYLEACEICRKLWLGEEV